MKPWRVLSFCVEGRVMPDSREDVRSAGVLLLPRIHGVSIVELIHASTMVDAVRKGNPVLVVHKAPKGCYRMGIYRAMTHYLKSVEMTTKHLFCGHGMTIEVTCLVSAVGVLA